MKTYTGEQVESLFDEIEQRIIDGMDEVKVIDDLVDYNDFDDDDVSLENVLYVDCCIKQLGEIKRDVDFIIKRRLG